MRKLLLVLVVFFLCGTAHAEDITFQWDSNTELDIVGYRLYQANESGTQVFGEQNSISGNILHILWTNTQQYILTEVMPGTWYWVATAYNTSGNESGPSNEVSKTVEAPPSDTTPPARMAGFEISDVDTIEPPQTDKVRLEVEGGVINPPMEIGQDPGAYNGAYVWSQSGGRVDNPDQTSSYVDLSFNVTVEDTYVLWGRVIAPSGSDDSFWFCMDGGEWKQWHTIGCTSWTWDRMDHRDAVDAPEQEVSYNLGLGNHVLRIAQREDGTKIDSVLITRGTEYTPTE